eukprot:comp21242_c0_seq1/m.28931 comp21242_c0_seq1/g.28931  ORF comp21242_c0_seq1/g.28931 comp21242_c0_seq1/m.28931 type:complete len:361 (+) comp21242_c0_seq1:1477-2559(+)
MHGADDIVHIVHDIVGKIVHGLDGGRAQAGPHAIQSLPAVPLVRAQVGPVDVDVDPRVEVPHTALGCKQPSILRVVLDHNVVVCLVGPGGLVNASPKGCELAGGNADCAHKGVCECSKHPTLTVLDRHMVAHMPQFDDLIRGRPCLRAGAVGEGFLPAPLKNPIGVLLVIVHDALGQVQRGEGWVTSVVELVKEIEGRLQTVLIVLPIEPPNRVIVMQTAVEDNTILIIQILLKQRVVVWAPVGPLILGVIRVVDQIDGPRIEELKPLSPLGALNYDANVVVHVNLGIGWCINRQQVLVVFFGLHIHHLKLHWPLICGNVERRALRQGLSGCYCELEGEATAHNIAKPAHSVATDMMILQ